MKKTLCRAWALVLVLALGFFSASASAAGAEDALQDTARYLQETVPAPQVGAAGGEWAVLGLARSGLPLPEGYRQGYPAALEAYLADRDGVLHQRKYTEYSRVILALSALGRDARDAAGYDLTRPLADYDKTLRQGLNGPIWALIALDSRTYPMPPAPQGATQATRQMYVSYILSRQLTGGGWSLAGETADADVTAMALQALAKYRTQAPVTQAIDAALARMSAQQLPSGGFASWGAANAESCAQMLVALGELGVSLDDPRFVKGGRTILDALLDFALPSGGFCHSLSDQRADPMATEQGFYALVSAQRARLGRESLYSMDPLPAPPGRHADVAAPQVTDPNRTFPDISGHPCREAVEALGARGIVAGRGDGLFDPDATITRGEFAALAVRALGLPPGAAGDFADVSPESWYAPYVGAAWTYRLVQGKAPGQFDPQGLITRQEAAVLTARAAQLCALGPQPDSAGVQAALAPYEDAGQVPPWARQGMAFCLGQRLLDGETALHGSEPIRRGEMAQMLYRLLDRAGLL